MTTVVSITSKNQLTLPSGLVQYLGLKKGSKLWLRVENRSVILDKVEDSWDDLQGYLANNPIAKKYSYNQVYKVAQKKEAKRLMKV